MGWGLGIWKGNGVDMVGWWAGVELFWRAGYVEDGGEGGRKGWAVSEEVRGAGAGGVIVSVG